MYPYSINFFWKKLFSFFFFFFKRNWVENGLGASWTCMKLFFQMNLGLSLIFFGWNPLSSIVHPWISSADFHVVQRIISPLWSVVHGVGFSLKIWLNWQLNPIRRLSKMTKKTKRSDYGFLILMLFFHLQIPFSSGNASLSLFHSCIFGLYILLFKLDTPNPYMYSFS